LEIPTQFVPYWGLIQAFFTHLVSTPQTPNTLDLDSLDDKIGKGSEARGLIEKFLTTHKIQIVAQPRNASRSSDASGVTKDRNLYPKLVALNLDYTVWHGFLNKEKFGKGSTAGNANGIEDNLERVNGWILRDRSNPENFISLFPDVPRIITDLATSGVQIVIVSRNTSKALCYRALYYFQAKDPRTKGSKPIIELARFNYICDEPITEHLKKMRSWSRFEYSDMILFDADQRSDEVKELGVTCKLLRDFKGLTWARYQEGLEAWRRKKSS